MQIPKALYRARILPRIFRPDLTIANSGVNAVVLNLQSDGLSSVHAPNDVAGFYGLRRGVC